MSAAAQRLEAWLSQVRAEEIDDALDDLAGSLEELVELARGDKHPGSPGTLAMEITREWDRADKALNVLGRNFDAIRHERERAA